MYPYRYSVSLRLFHPRIDPRVITDRLGKVPKHSWQAGTPRTTPRGDPLEGIHRESYLVAELEKARRSLCAAVAVWVSVVACAGGACFAQARRVRARLHGASQFSYN